MRKLLAALALASVAAFGLSACSGGSSPEAPKEEVATAPAETPASESDGSIDITVCAELSALLADASLAMQSNDAGGEEAITEMADVFGSLAAKASNTEIRDAALAVQADLVALHDAGTRLEGGDPGAAQDALNAQANFQKSYAVLVGLCMP